MESDNIAFKNMSNEENKNNTGNNQGINAKSKF